MYLYNNIHCSKKYKNTGSNRSSKKRSNFITISNWNEEDNHSCTRLQDAVSRLTISGAVLNISCDNRQVKNVRSYQLLTYLSTLEFLPVTELLTNLSDGVRLTQTVHLQRIYLTYARANTLGAKPTAALSQIAALRRSSGNRRWFLEFVRILCQHWGNATSQLP